MSLDARMMRSRDVCKWGHRETMGMVYWNRLGWLDGYLQEKRAEFIANTVRAHMTARQIMLRNGYIEHI